MFVPDLSTNLLSVRQMVNKNLIVVFSEAGCSIYHKDDVKIKGKVSGTATHINGLFRLDEFSCNKDVNSNDSVKTFAATPEVSKAANLWHRRLGHMCHERMFQLEKMVDGYKCIDKPDNPCVGCCLGKQTRMPYNHPGTRCMLKDARLPDDLWAEACSTAAYIKNRSPHSGLKDCTPEQMWTGKRPDIRNFKVFGCKCMVHIPDTRRKWDPKSELYTFLGYGDMYGCYRVLDKNRQVRIARNVVFFEDSTSVDDTEKNAHIDSVVPLLERETTPDEVDPIVGEADSEGENSDDNVNNPNVNAQSEFRDEVHVERCPLRDRKAREFPDFVTYFSPVDITNDPLTPREAFSRMDRDR
jgi:hypothetical protein